MVIKWILLITLVFLVFWFFKQFRKIQRKSPDTTRKVIEDMVRCTYCDVHLPKSESIVEHGRYFCCTKHRQLYSQSRPDDK
ncbi:PP0621 family protein [Nitrosomonas europaea]|uniref:PP0621 family protein n=1 Tax=Nitrosomonas europaea TaxID=915 RepID=UPI003265721D